MRERSTKCTLYSAYVTLDDPRGAPSPAGTRRGPPGCTISHDRYWRAQHGLGRLFTALSRVGPGEAARAPACSARAPTMLPHAPHIPPVHAHALVPSPRPHGCDSVPVNAQRSVSWQQTEAQMRLSSRCWGGGTPSEPLSGHPYAPHMSTLMGRSKEDRQRPTDRPVAASQQHIQSSSSNRPRCNIGSQIYRMSGGASAMALGGFR